MAKRLQRVEVGKRKFAYTYGLAWLAVKEYAKGECACGDSRDHHEVKGTGKCAGPGCLCRHFNAPKLLSFAVDRPKVVDRRTVREIISERIGWKKGTGHGQDK
jgi:hypothetical protein